MTRSRGFTFIITLVMMNLVVNISLAESTSLDKQEFCSQLGKVAQYAMAARQAGMNKSDLEEAISGNARGSEQKEFFNDLVDQAWEVPVRGTASDRRDEVAIFSAAVVVNCRQLRGDYEE